MLDLIENLNLLEDILVTKLMRSSSCIEMLEDTKYNHNYIKIYTFKNRNSKDFKETVRLLEYYEIPFEIKTAMIKNIIIENRHQFITYITLKI